VPGTGLGLPIVKGPLESRIGGSIVVDSDGETGTSVLVRVPRTPPPIVPTAPSLDAVSQRETE